MRAEVASHFGGHPYSKEYLEMDEAQLYILYVYVKESEKEKKLGLLTLIKDVMEVSLKHLSELFSLTHLFIDRKLFKQVSDYKKTQEQMPPKEEAAVTEDNFEEEWEKMMGIVPNRIIVEERVNVEEFLEVDRGGNTELDQKMEFWLKRRKRERGDVKWK